VKPSGTTLAGIEPADFVALDRNRLSNLYRAGLPSEVPEREAAVMEIVEASVLPDSTGRPSVEAPLHDSLSARFVVHTHPPIVNGMTCAVNGAHHSRHLFPDALWIDYTDPGYSLCMEVRREVEAYRGHRGYEPSVIFIGNHGVFVAGDEADQIAGTYSEIFACLEDVYQRAGVQREVKQGDAPPRESITRNEEIIRSAWSESPLHFAVSGHFSPAEGPITPDHIVYAGACPIRGKFSAEGITLFLSRHGYDPKIAVFEDAVFGLGESSTAAELALEVARDAALVVQFAGVFGGIEYMDDRARRFIEGWEVETYRRKQV